MSADPCGCGCCTPASGAALMAVSNPPGLPAVGYRIGTYLTFREALLEQLAGSLALAPLTTRDPSDYALVVLDSWSYLADILTFYSERTLNEAFLRTARLRDSVVRLAGMIGYDPSPGLAATAPLAFTAQAATRFTLAAGARVQSTPAPGDTSPPVKFETLADVSLSQALNALPLLAPPQAASPLAPGSSRGSLAPGATLPGGLTVGSALVAWSAAAGTVEHKGLQALTSDPPAGGISWSPPLAAGAQALHLAVKTVHLFGYDAPPTGVSVSGLATDSSGNTSVTLQQIDTVYSQPATAAIQLDGVYADISAGDQLLICSSSEGIVAASTVTAASSAPSSFDGPIHATVTELTVSPSLPAITDIRTVEVTVLGAAIPLWDRSLPTQITGATVYAQLDPSQAPPDRQSVVLGDATGVAYQATVLSSGPATDLPGAVAIILSPGLAGPLDPASAVLLGNVVLASQGEAVSGELLGSGDATVPGQRFPLAKPPITYVPHAGAPHGGESTLVVSVGGVEWTEVQYLYGAGPGDRVYVVERDDDGSYWVRFGDGAIGARLPSGAQVTADYRTGLGSAGNVGPGALRLPLTRPTGLAAVSNPVAAAGGADPETLDEARANAPNTVRTFERIVSLEDFEDQARENALVAKASAAWVLVGSEPGVSLVVAGPDGAVLGPDQLAQLQADLDARRDPNRPLAIRSYVPLALTVAVRLLAVQADLEPDDVRAAVQAALLGHFAFDVRQFGQPVHLSEVFVAAQGAPGVLGVDVDALTLADASQLAPHQLSTAPIQQRIDLATAELATLAIDDLTVIGP